MKESIEKNNIEKFEEFIQAVEIKLEVFETNISTLKKSLIEKDEYISNLEKKILDLRRLMKYKLDKLNIQGI
jgi:archaellum component FlaC